MKEVSRAQRMLVVCVVFVAASLVSARLASADASKYPQFAQRSLPANVIPSFISIDELVQEIRAGKKPLLVDVRSAEEFREAHILGAVSAPLADFGSYVQSVPRDRLVVLY